MSDHAMKTPNDRRRSERPRKPLVIEGHARRLDEAAPRNRLSRSAGYRPLGTPRWTEPSQTLEGEAGKRTTFFGRRPEPEVDLFRHGDAKPADDAPDEEIAPPSNAPLKIACIAGVVMAVLFILPNLFDLAGGAVAARISTSARDASLGNGLDVSNIKADLLAREGASVLTLTGEVSNAASDQTVPPIEIVLTDGEGGRVVRRIEVTRSALRTGERLGFSSSVLLPDDMKGRLELSLRPAAPTNGNLR
ncbi:hypothetical protein [Fulvimarina sp. MAC8]|uniref:hypothetical protein n=1 Tax=Fulvimarina sp. MAC8 TaxID=3162874 RepID=UPI0032ED816A